MTSVLYPRRFEIYRLEALGDNPYLPDDEAHEQYEQGRGLTVVPAGDPISWTLDVSAKAFRFTVSFHTSRKKLVRRVTWEQVDGMLVRRRIVDRFYPAGEEQVPLVDVITVTQDISTDGVLELTVRTPGRDDEFTQVDGAIADELREPVPEFGDWHPLVEASRPDEVTRTGDGAAAAAQAHVRSVLAAGAGAGRAGDSMWRVPADAEVVARHVDALVAGAGDEARAEVPTGRIPSFTRGDATIVPLAAQHGTQHGDPREQRSRMRALAGDVDGAWEYRAGRGIPLDLARTGDDEVAAYTAALREAGATEATWWEVDPAHGVTLVWTGDENRGDLTLALHLVPIAWVSDRRTHRATARIDVRWSPAEVVPPASAASDPADSVAEQDETS